METPDLGSRRKRLLHRALRARRNRSQLSHLGRQTHEGSRETKVGLARRWTPTQRLGGISRRLANREVGRPSGLWALKRSERSRRKCSAGGSASPKTMTRTVAGGANIRRQSRIVCQRVEDNAFHLY